MEKEYFKLPEDIRKSLPLSKFKESGFLNKDDAKENLKKIAKQAMPTVRKEVYAGFENNVGILSLTTCPKNLLMWAHYANSHQGLVLEIDETHEFFNRRKSSADELRHLREVTYSTKRPSTSLSDMNFELFLVKSEDWAYEEEWRMLLPLAEANEVIPSKPHDIHLFKLPICSIKSVIFGHRATENTKSIVSTILAGENDKSHIYLYQANIDDQEFKINFEKI